MPYTAGDKLRAVTESVRRHKPRCVAQKGECGCSLELFPQPTRYFINNNEVGKSIYEEVQADYKRQRDLGLVD